MIISAGTVISIMQGRVIGKNEMLRQFLENHKNQSLINPQMEKNESKIPYGNNQIRPNHYGGKSNPLEAIKIIDHYGLGFNLGNAVKYILRCGKKDSKVNELRKAITYLEFELEKELADVDVPPITQKKVSFMAIEKPVESVWCFTPTNGERIAKVRSLIITVGHEAAIALYEKEIELLENESPKNLFKIQQCFEAMALIKKRFEVFKAQINECKENENTNG